MAAPDVVTNNFPCCMDMSCCLVADLNPEGVQMVEVSGTQNFFLNNFPETDLREKEF
jgi:hypothetical protein